MPDNETMQLLFRYLQNTSENFTVVRCSQFLKGAAKIYVTEMY